MHEKPCLMPILKNGVWSVFLPDAGSVTMQDNMSI